MYQPTASYRIVHRKDQKRESKFVLRQQSLNKERNSSRRVRVTTGVTTQNHMTSSFSDSDCDGTLIRQKLN
jgi:hypothetical protein